MMVLFRGTIFFRVQAFAYEKTVKQMTVNALFVYTNSLTENHAGHREDTRQFVFQLSS